MVKARYSAFGLGVELSLVRQAFSGWALAVVSPPPNLMMSVFYRMGCFLAISRVVVLEYLAL